MFQRLDKFVENVLRYGFLDTISGGPKKRELEWLKEARQISKWDDTDISEMSNERLIRAINYCRRNYPYGKECYPNLILEAKARRLISMKKPNILREPSEPYERNQPI